MTAFHSKQNSIAIPPLRKTGKVLKPFPRHHTNNNILLRHPTRHPLPFQTRSINSGLIFGSPSSPSSPSSSFSSSPSSSFSSSPSSSFSSSPSSSFSSSPSSSFSSSPLSPTDIIAQLLHHFHLQSDKPVFDAIPEIGRLSLYDLPSSYSPLANKSGNNSTTVTTSYLDAPSSLPPPANKHSSSSSSTTLTSFLDFLNRRQEGTEPIQTPEEYLFHPHAATRYEDQFLDQCYPDSSMYGTHMILTNFETEADRYNSRGYNKLPSTSNSKTYRDVIEHTPPKGCDPVLYYNFLGVPPRARSGHPHHSLKLKVGYPIMLLEEVSGVCAGTMLIVEKLEEDLITAREVEAVGGHGGERGKKLVRIRRQEYEESTRVEPMITYTRKQFPVKRAFALAVDDVPKGVTFEGLGLDLTYDMVSPGQLHTTLSWCRDLSRLKLYIPEASASDTTGQYSSPSHLASPSKSHGSHHSSNNVPSQASYTHPTPYNRPGAPSHNNNSQGYKNSTSRPHAPTYPSRQQTNNIDDDFEGLELSKEDLEDDDFEDLQLTQEELDDFDVDSDPNDRHPPWQKQRLCRSIIRSLQRSVRLPTPDSVYVPQRSGYRCHV